MQCNLNCIISQTYIFEIRQLCNRKNLITQQAPIICPICKRSDRVVTDPESGEIVCSNCGMVISDKMQDIDRPERRVFLGSGQERNNNNSRIRTGAPLSLARHDMGLSTIIGRTDKDASGHKIDTEIRSTMERLRIQDSRIQPHTPTDQNLKLALISLI
jgi:transcription initiation factor TFIIB